MVAIWLIYMRKIVGAAPHFCFHFVPARSSPSKEYTRCCAFELLLVFLFFADMYSKSFLVRVPDFTIFHCTPGGAFIIILFFFRSVCNGLRHVSPRARLPAMRRGIVRVCLLYRRETLPGRCWFAYFFETSVSLEKHENALLLRRREPRLIACRDAKNSATHVPETVSSFPR